MREEWSSNTGKPFEVRNHDVQQFIEQCVVRLGRFGLGQKALDVGEIALEIRGEPDDRVPRHVNRADRLTRGGA